jgi:hypothetical protein
MKVSELADTPEKLLPKRLRPHYVDDNASIISPSLMKDPGFYVPAVAYPTIGTGAYVAARRSQKKRNAGRKKEL